MLTRCFQSSSGGDLEFAYDTKRECVPTTLFHEDWWSNRALKGDDWFGLETPLEVPELDLRTRSYV